MTKHLVFLTGAGMSQESGIATFRDSDGLWEGHDVMEVASPWGFEAQPDLVLDFYSQRRKNVMESEPNDGHRIIAELEQDFDVSVVTQNVDDLHERGGSSKVLHLHGEIMKSRSVGDGAVYDLDHWELKRGDLCPNGHQLRPHIVWFGEQVPMIEPAAEIVASADIVVVVGTSLVVYPAAGLVDLAPPGTPMYIIDPRRPEIMPKPHITFIETKACEGLCRLRDMLRSA
ncbi:MAG: NAD-dependent deacylase [Planctomycetales bacterium]|nr:NAD-dependent deacylase [Planctomycetales bacterium]